MLAWYVVGDQWLHAAVTITFAITDIYDGKLARLYNSASPLGGFFDHGTDALLVSVSAWALAGWSHPPVALAFHLIRLCAVRIRLQHPAGRVLRTSKLADTTALAITYWLVPLSAARRWRFCLMRRCNIGLLQRSLQWLDLAIALAAWLLLASTILSIGERLIHLLRRDL